MPSLQHVRALTVAAAATSTTTAAKAPIDGGERGVDDRAERSGWRRLDAQRSGD